MRLIILVHFFVLCSLFSCQQNTSQLKLWYNKPSGGVWENALPIGNGFQAAMVYGNVEKEIFQLNEHTVWSGSPNRNDNPDALKALPEVIEINSPNVHSIQSSLIILLVIHKIHDLYNSLGTFKIGVIF